MHRTMHLAIYSAITTSKPVPDGVVSSLGPLGRYARTGVGAQWIRRTALLQEARRDNGGPACVTTSLGVSADIVCTPKSGGFQTLPSNSVLCSAAEPSRTDSSVTRCLVLVQVTTVQTASAIPPSPLHNPAMTALRSTFKGSMLDLQRGLAARAAKPISAASRLTREWLSRI
ncbi:hypothetical protein VTI28DRAFT_6030 [Corynascus sepedonium]